MHIARTMNCFKCLAVVALASSFFVSPSNGQEMSWDYGSPFYTASVRVSENGMEAGIWRRGDPFAEDVEVKCGNCPATHLQASLASASQPTPRLDGPMVLGTLATPASLVKPAGENPGLPDNADESAPPIKLLGSEVQLERAVYLPAPEGASDPSAMTGWGCAITAMKVGATALFECDDGATYVIDCAVTDGYTCASTCSNTDHECTNMGECSDNEDCTHGDVCSKYEDCTAAPDSCSEGDDCTQGDNCSEGANCSSGDWCTWGGDCSRGDDCTGGENCSSGLGCTYGEDCSNNQPPCTTMNGCSDELYCSEHNDNCTPPEREVDEPEVEGEGSEPEYTKLDLLERPTTLFAGFGLIGALLMGAAAAALIARRKGF